MSKTLEKAASDYAYSEEYSSLDSFNRYEHIFKAGAEFMKKEYEEKLRWIPVEEKDAPHGIVQMKLENGETLFGHFTDKIKTTCNVFEFIKVTHYRELYFYNAT